MFEGTQCRPRPARAHDAMQPPTRPDSRLASALLIALAEPSPASTPL